MHLSVQFLKISISGILSIGLMANLFNSRIVQSSEVQKNRSHVDTVLISGMAFNPQEIYVHKGDTIVWINQDMVPHCVTEVPDKSWTSSAILPGKSWKLTVIQSADYYCAIHQVMTGKIVVK